MPQRHIPFRTTATAVVLAAAALLAGCGSSHHDSPTEATVPLQPGTYRGTLNLTVTGPGGVSSSGSSPVVIVLSPNGTVQVGAFPATTVQGNTFVTNSPASALNTATLKCTSGTFGATGTFNGPTVTGAPISSGLVCNGFPFVASGNFTAQLSASELPRGGAGGDAVFDTFRKALEQALPR